MAALPTFVEHTTKGALFGAMLGGTIAAVGWEIRRRNASVIDLGVDAPHLLTRYRSIAETLMQFREVANVSPAAWAFYRQMVLDCDFIAANDGATGGTQVHVQKRVTQAIFCANKIAREAFRARNPQCHECRTHVDVLKGALSGIQKNMMM